MALRALTIGALASFAGASIYPDDHWTKSFKMTQANFQEKVKTEVDAGKTLFIRFIASEG